jgi:hypothetical protein
MYQLKLAFRNLFRNRLYTSINIIGLSIGLAAIILIYKIVSHELAYKGGGLDKGILRVLIHKVHLVGVGAGALFHRFRHGPQPGGIHMTMPGEAHIWGGRPVFLL